MNNWEELHIGNEINILSGYPFDSKKFNTDKEGKPLIRIRDILESSINTYFSGSYSDAFLIKKGDILVGMDGDFHVAKWNNIDALLNQRILKVHQKKDAKIDIDYFYYFLQPFLKKVHDITAATTVKHLSTFDIIKAKKPFPEVKHQQKIAKILNTIDAVIEKTEQVITKYQDIKKGMMHDLFTRGIDLKTRQLRPSFNDAPELYKESALGMIPEEWDLKPLSKLGVIKSGIDYKSNPKGDEYPIYGTGGIMGWTSRFLNSGPAVLTGRKGTINNPLFVEGKFWNVDTIFCINSINLKEVDIKWLFYNFRNTDLTKLNEATGVPSVNSSSLYKLKFKTPLFKEQQEITLRLSKIDLLIEKEQKILAKHQKIKKGLMQDLLTGKVEVKV